MQKGRVLRINSYGFFEFFKKNTFLLTVTFIFAVGIFIGVFSFEGFALLKSYSNEYITDYIVLRQNGSFGGILFNALLNNLALLFIFFLLGTSLFGVITVPVGIALKGVLQGGVTAFLYSSYGIKGVAFNAIILIPCAIVLFIVLLLACRESIRFSLRLASLTLNKTMPFNMAQDFKEYSSKYLLFSAGCLLSAFIDATVSLGLIKHFTL